MIEYFQKKFPLPIEKATAEKKEHALVTEEFHLWQSIYDIYLIFSWKKKSVWRKWEREREKETALLRYEYKLVGFRLRERKKKRNWNARRCLKVTHVVEEKSRRIEEEKKTEPRKMWIQVRILRFFFLLVLFFVNIIHPSTNVYAKHMYWQIIQHRQIIVSLSLSLCLNSIDPKVKNILLSVQLSSNYPEKKKVC